MTTAKPVPGYLDPREFTSATAHCIYEPPLSPGTRIRLRRWSKQAGDDDLPSDETVTIVGFDEWEETAFSQATGQMEPTGRMIPYAYSLWDTEKPPSIGDWGQFNEYCEREGITDQDAFLETEAGKRWLTGGHKVGDRRCFEIGRGQFHSALLGGQWIPVVYETVRTQVRPVMGWALESAAQTSFKGDEQSRGHRRIARDKKTGRLLPESNVTRRRWTTTLDVNALEELDRISAATGQHRNEIVEALILGAAKPAPGAGMDKPATTTATAVAEPGSPARDISSDELTTLIHRLCHDHGSTWPRGIASQLAARAGISKQSVSQRKRSALAAIAQVAAEKAQQ